MNKKLLSATLLFAIFTTARMFAQAPQDRRSEQWRYTEWERQDLPSDDNWWLRFDDPVLDSLITMGENANYDVVAAMHRMDAASRQIAVAKAAYYPTVGVNAGYTRTHADGANTNTYALQGAASWQIDIFGKITESVRQKKASYKASRAQWVGTMVSMAAQIATTYTNLRVWQNELLVAQEQSHAQDSIQQLVKARYEAGLEAHMQLAQAQALTSSTNATIPGLLTSIHTAENALALLVGADPADIRRMVHGLAPIPEWRQLVPTDIDLAILRRRPDIVEAEANLAAAAAALGIAKKEFLPTLSVNGTVGVSAPKVGDMFTSRGFGYTVAPTLSWTVFDGMARRAGVQAARDEMEALTSTYNQTFQNACNEVDNASVSYVNNLRTISDYEEATRNAAEFLVSSLELYTQGLITYSDVATAQKTYLSYSNSLIAARGAAVTALVDLYQALGGGF